MTSAGTGIGDVFDELAQRYEKWRRISVATGQVVPDTPVWDGGRLHFRSGYPKEGWTGYALAPRNPGYDVLWITTERRVEAAERLEAHFSRLEDAGKYIIWNNAESVRLNCGLQPVTRAWREHGLNPKVIKRQLTDKLARYSLKDDPDVYFDCYVGGIKPENHLLALDYDELEAELFSGMPTIETD